MSLYGKVFKIFFIHLSVLLFFTTSWADLGGARSLGVDCLNPDDDCPAVAYQNAQLAAQERALAIFESVARQAALDQSETCQTQVTRFGESCSTSMYQELLTEAQQLQNQIDEKTAMSTRTHRELTGDLSNQNSVQGIIDRLTRLNEDIATLLSSLGEIKSRTDSLDNVCTNERQSVMNACSAPRAELKNGSSVIVQNEVTPNSSNRVETPVPPASAISYDVEAEAVATVTGDVAAPEVSQRRQGFERTYYSTTLTAGRAHEEINTAETLGTTTVQQSLEIIRSLQALVSNSPESGDICDITQGPCDSTEPAPSSVRPQARPENISGVENAPVPTPAPRSGDGGAPAVSGDDLIADVNAGPAYGSTPSPSGGGADVAGRGLSTPGAGGLMNSLGGLGSMFGKTGGGFGSEGYGSSSNGRFASGGLNTQNRSGPGYALPDQNVDFTPNSRTADPGAPIGQPRAFNAGLGNNAQGNSFGGAAGGGGMPATGGGSTGGRGGSGQKPGLLSRLLGKKRDKTMFGKTENSGRGGSFRNAGKASPSAGLNGAYEDSANVTLDANGRRVFDASKYAPSQAAQDRAYARATGRRIASTVPRPGGGSMDWPSDISKDRNGNMFMKVRLSHTSFINNARVSP